MKKILTVMLALLILVSSVFVVAASNEETTENNIKTYLHEETGTLIVSGSGEIKDLYPRSDENSWPYYTTVEVNTTVKHLVIDEGITAISNSFNDLQALQDITLPDSLESIALSFIDCDKLKSVEFPDTLKKIEFQSFNDCDEIEDLYFPENVAITDKTNVGVFKDLDSLEFLFIPTGANIAGGFVDCKNLKKVVFEDDTVTIVPSDYLDIESGVESSFFCEDRATDILFFVEKSNKSFNIEYYDDEIIRVNTVPGKLNAVCGVNGVELSWECLINADVYHIYRKENSEKEWTEIGSTRFGSYTDETAVSGKTYSYKIKTDDNDTEVVAQNVLYLDSVEVKTCVSSGSKTVLLKWNKVAGAKGYFIYQSPTGKAGSWTRIANIKSGNTSAYTVKGLKSGNKYYFCIRAYNGKLAGLSANKKAVIAGAPVAAASFNDNGITVKWNKLSDVAYYRVYFKNSTDKGYTTVATVKNPAKVSTTISESLIKSDVCYVKVRAFYKDGSHMITNSIRVK